MYKIRIFTRKMTLNSIHHTERNYEDEIHDLCKNIQVKNVKQVKMYNMLLAEYFYLQHIFTC